MIERLLQGATGRAMPVVGSCEIRAFLPDANPRHWTSVFQVSQDLIWIFYALRRVACATIWTELSF